MWRVTFDMWLVTCSMWHMTCNVRHVTVWLQEGGSPAQTDSGGPSRRSAHSLPVRPPAPAGEWQGGAPGEAPYSGGHLWLGLVDPHHGLRPYSVPSREPSREDGHHQHLRGAGQTGESPGHEVRQAQAGPGLSGGPGGTHPRLLPARLQANQRVPRTPAAIPPQYWDLPRPALPGLQLSERSHGQWGHICLHQPDLSSAWHSPHVGIASHQIRSLSTRLYTGFSIPVKFLLTTETTGSLVSTASRGWQSSSLKESGARCPVRNFQPSLPGIQHFRSLIST